LLAPNSFPRNIIIICLIMCSRASFAVEIIT
jgi:hypothetical protein